MANSDLQNGYFVCPDEVVNSIKGQLSSYEQGGNTKGLKRAKGIVEKKQISYSHIKRLKNYFDNYKGDGTDDEYKLNGGDKMKKWVDNTLKGARDSIHNIKKTRMDAGEENQFKKTHTKDRDNADPTRVRLPRPHKGSVQRQIMTNKVTYESVSDEMEEIKYLIEYMNNNNKQTL